MILFIVIGFSFAFLSVGWALYMISENQREIKEMKKRLGI